MRVKTDKIIFLGLILLSFHFEYAEGTDFFKLESFCKEIGFTPKTEAFGECVLELVEREKINNGLATADADSQTCLNYGFKPQTEAFAECKFKLDAAKQESARAQEQYSREKDEYDKKIAAIENERRRQQGLRQMEFGLRLMGGQRPVDALTSVGTGRPVLPTPPSPINQTIITPSGKVINCTTTGSFTNCF